MGGRQNNFQDKMLSSRDIRKTKYHLLLLEHPSANKLRPIMTHISDRLYAICKYLWESNNHTLQKPIVLTQRFYFKNFQPFGHQTKKNQYINRPIKNN